MITSIGCIEESGLTEGDTVTVATVSLMELNRVLLRLGSKVFKCLRVVGTSKSQGVMEQSGIDSGSRVYEVETSTHFISELLFFSPED